MSMQLGIGLVAALVIGASSVSCTGGTQVGSIPSGAGGSELDAAIGSGGGGAGGSELDAAIGSGGGGAGGGGAGGFGGGGAAGTAGAAGNAGGGAGGADVSGPIQVLVWNNARNFANLSRLTAIPLFLAREAADDIKFDLTYADTEDSPFPDSDERARNLSVFTDTGLEPYDVVFFLNPTGATLDGRDQATTHRDALVNFIKKGRGFVGTHSAAWTYDRQSWPWYVDFIGARVVSMSANGLPGTARYHQDMTHPVLVAAVAPNPWDRQDAWLRFDANPLDSAIPGIRILQSSTDLEIATEQPATWVREMPLEPGADRQGRMFYTAFGFSSQAFEDPKLIDLIIAGIKWAAHRL